jgi:hypothetical protein
LQGGGGGLMVLFSKKNILIPNVAEENILILVEEKKMIQSFCQITFVHMESISCNIFSMCIIKLPLQRKTYSIK